MKPFDGPVTSGLSASCVALVTITFVSSCVASPESAFRDFVNETPTEAGRIELSAFADWDEAVLTCSLGSNQNFGSGEVDSGRLELYRDGTVIADYAPSLDDRIVFCPRLEGQSFSLRYPNGTLLLTRSEPVLIPFTGERFTTFLYLPQD